ELKFLTDRCLRTSPNSWRHCPEAEWPKPRPVQEENEQRELTASEINDAENAWIKSVQANPFENEIRYLARKKTKEECLASPKYVTQFGLYVDQQGIVRCVGRIGDSTLSSNCIHPILLPSRHYFVELLIEHTHKHTVLHNGTRDTLTALRERFWVIRGRESVKKVIRKCVTSLKHEGISYTSLPSSSELKKLVTKPTREIDNAKTFKEPLVEIEMMESLLLELINFGE
ncbi:Hypothetical predicted protein, partial [Paramuricea clavata]